MKRSLFTRAAVVLAAAMLLTLTAAGVDNMAPGDVAGSVMDGAREGAQDVMDGAEDAVDGVVGGAESVLDGAVGGAEDAVDGVVGTGDGAAENGDVHGQAENGRITDSTEGAPDDTDNGKTDAVGGMEFSLTGIVIALIAAAAVIAIVIALIPRRR